jgi:penicillin-binding protein 1C
VSRHVVAAVLAIVSFGVAAATAVPSFDEVKAAYRPSEAWLLDHHGEVIQSFRVDAEVRRLKWVPLDELSPALKEALIAAEDKRFLEHGGVDWKAFVGAAWSNLWRGMKGQRRRGASTLTMQLVGMIDPALQPTTDGRSLGQKWDQALAAREMEKHWSKEQILEAYFNLARFRGELTGIEAVSRALFKKQPSGIDRPEAAIIVALLRGPAASPKVVGTRACNVARTIAPASDCNAIQALAVSSLSGRYRLEADVNLAPHLRRLAGAAGSRTTTTLDAELQRLAVETLHEQLAELLARNVEDGAVVVLDNATGDVLAYVGSSGELSQAGQVDGANAPRQAGSTLKPFLYGLALEQRLLTAASILDDTPLALATEAGLYVPQNYDKDFKGPVTVRTALASSLNVPAVRTLMLTGFGPFRDRLRALGLETIEQPGAYYGYALALGSAEVTLLQLTNAYRAIANGGRWGAARFRSDEPASRTRRVMEEGSAFIIADILSDRAARSLTFGLDNPLATRFWTAVKTGTSKDMRDNWCIGFSDRFTVGVWVGNASGEPMRDVSGITGAAPIWREMMYSLHAGQSSSEPVAPKGVVRSAVHSTSNGLEAQTDEWYLEGTMELSPHSMALKPGDVAPRIAYPGMGTIIALDPDIPKARQWVLFKSMASPGTVRWKLDGELVADGRWAPLPGHHRLELQSSAEAELDEVEFEVRGEAVKEDATAP